MSDLRQSIDAINAEMRALARNSSPTADARFKELRKKRDALNDQKAVDESTQKAA